EWLKGGLQVNFLSPELLGISLSGTNPAELVTLINAVANVYETEIGKKEREIRQNRVKKLDVVVSKLTAVVKRNKAAYAKYVETTGATNSGQRQTLAEFQKFRLAGLLSD